MRITCPPKLSILAAVVLALSAQSSTAQQSSSGQCSGIGAADLGELITVLQVAPARKRLNFIKSPDSAQTDCPSASPACRDTAFLVAGDVVLTARAPTKGHVCASFADKRGRETSGWLPADALVAVATGKVEDKGWLGTWRRTEATIKIARGKSKALKVEGEATFGAHDKARVARGAVNMGEFEGAARRSGDTAFVAAGDITSFEKAPKDRCAVRMRRVGPYLLVEDNQACGGANVSFTGLYVKR